MPSVMHVSLFKFHRTAHICLPGTSWCHWGLCQAMWSSAVAEHVSFPRDMFCDCPALHAQPPLYSEGRQSVGEALSVFPVQGMSCKEKELVSTFGYATPACTSANTPSILQTKPGSFYNSTVTLKVPCPIPVPHISGAYFLLSIV